MRPVVIVIVAIRLPQPPLRSLYPNRTTRKSPSREIGGEPGGFGAFYVTIFAGQNTACERRVGNEADAFAAADIGQRILETAVVQAEIILDRLVARRAELFRRRQALHQAPRAL